MSASERDGEALRVLAAMPFLDRLELAAVAGMTERTAHNALTSLEEQDLADAVRHASAITATTRRWHVTSSGWRLLAQQEGSSLRGILHRYPGSAHWQRVLLARLDAVAVMYRLAATLADAAGDSPRFRWYRADPLDAAVALPGGRTLGVIRQGGTVDRTAFSDRVGRLLDPERALPQALLALLPDGAHLRQSRRLLARYPGPVYLATERDVARSLAADPVWRHTLRRHRPRPPAGPGPPRTRRVPAGGARPVQGVPTG